MKTTILSKKKTAECYDCGRQYGNEHGFPDLLIPDWAWEKISPTKNGGGLLCPSCICRRLHKAGIKDIPSAFTSGPLNYQVMNWIKIHEGNFEAEKKR